MINIILLIVTIYSYLNCPLYVNELFMWGQVIIMLFSVLSFFGEKDNVHIKNDTLRLSVIYVIGYIVVYFQKDIDYLLGLTSMENKVIWCDQFVVCKCMVISNLTLQSFFWGYRFKKRSLIKIDKQNKTKTPIININITLLNVIASMLLLLFVVTVDKRFLLGGYGHHEMGTMADYCIRFAQGLITASIAVRCLQYKSVRKSTKLIQYFKFMKTQIWLSIVFVFLITLSGARHLALVILCVNIISFTYGTGYKFKIGQLAIGLIIVGSLITLRGIIRRETYGGSLDSIELTQSISPFTEELSTSIMTLHGAVSAVPNHYPYNYGLTLIAKPFLIIPGMASLIQNQLGLDVSTANSSQLITAWVLGPEASFGMGSSSIADIYICFGLFGTLIIFFIWGMFLRYIENGLYILNRRSVYFIIIAFVVYSQAIYVSRESLFTILQGISYPLIFYYLFVGNRISK